MSAEINSDSFRENILAVIKEIQGELNKLKTIKRDVVKKSTKKKTAKRRTIAKRKPARKTVKRKTAKRRTIAKRKPARRRQVPGKPSYLTNLCPNQYENS